MLDIIGRKMWYQKRYHLTSDFNMEVFKRTIKGRQSKTYSVKFRFRGKQYLLSTKKSNEEAAWSIARQRYNAVVGEHFKSADEMKLRNDYATIGDVVRLYLEKPPVLSYVARANVNALKLIVRVVLGLDEKANVDDQRINILTREFALRFQELRQQTAKESGKDLAANTSINAFMRRAKSLFSKRLLNRDFYKDLKLSDVKAFCSVPTLKEPSHKHQQIPNEDVQMMIKAAGELKKDNPRLYLVHLLFSRLGLRNKEIFHAKRTWISSENGRNTLWIIRRDDYVPKGSDGPVPIPSDVMEEILNRADSGSDYIVPGKNQTERYNVIYRDHSKWVKQFIKGRQKTSYVLRKHAGSIIVMREKSIFAAQKFLRHKHYSTADMHYADLLESLKPIEAEQIARPS